jgi:hypothetical protein
MLKRACTCTAQHYGVVVACVRARRLPFGVRPSWGLSTTMGGGGDGRYDYNHLERNGKRGEAARISDFGRTGAAAEIPLYTLASPPPPPPPPARLAQIIVNSVKLLLADLVEIQNASTNGNNTGCPGDARYRAVYRHNCFLRGIIFPSEYVTRAQFKSMDRIGTTWRGFSSIPIAGNGARVQT